MVIGIDYGTDSVRAVLIDSRSGEALAASAFAYPRWKRGLYCNPAVHAFRQHPLDYMEGLEHVVRDLLRQHPEAASTVKAISVDTTGSTPVAIDAEGMPLALHPAFAENPNAMFVLWKDHTAIDEADEINAKARTWGGVDFTRYSGGDYSSEWFWAKMLHIVRHDEAVAQAAFTWMEHCDWIPAMLVGNKMPQAFPRSRCAAGHKAMWHEEWGGFPPDSFLGLLDRRLATFRRRMNDVTVMADSTVGHLCAEWADRLGLTTAVLVGSGALDAHFGAVGAEIKPHYLCKVIGTSTCDMMTVPPEEMLGKRIRGIAGQVNGSIIPGFVGLEAGQSAFGDIYAWFRNLLMWTVRGASDAMGLPMVDPATTEKLSDAVFERLAHEAQGLEDGPLSLDWLNGRRTPDMNMHVTGTITGLTLGTGAPHIYKSLVEATAFGAKAIVERLLDEGVRPVGVIALGGVARKSAFVMQTLADVLGMPIKVVRSEETCALGAAMFAAVVAGTYPTVLQAQEAMGKGFQKQYLPDREKVAGYAAKYEQYKTLAGFVEHHPVA